MQECRYDYQFRSLYVTPISCWVSLCVMHICVCSQSPDVCAHTEIMLKFPDYQDMVKNICSVNMHFWGAQVKWKWQKQSETYNLVSVFGNQRLWTRRDKITNLHSTIQESNSNIFSIRANCDNKSIIIHFHGTDIWHCELLSSLKQNK